MHQLIEKTLNIKDDNITLFEALCEAMLKLNLNQEESVKVIKKDKPFMIMLQKDLSIRNMIK